MRPSWSTFAFVTCVSGDRRMLSGVLPQPFQPTSPPAPAPAPANARAAVVTSTASPSQDALGRLILRGNGTPLAHAPIGDCLWGCDVNGSIEAPVALVHEVRGGLHPHLERAQRPLGDANVVPTRRLRVVEGDAPVRRRLADDVRVLPRDPERDDLVVGRWARLNPRLSAGGLAPPRAPVDPAARAVLTLECSLFGAAERPS